MTPRTHFSWGYGGILCRRSYGAPWAWRIVTDKPKDVTCKFCLRAMAKP